MWIVNCSKKLQKESGDKGDFAASGDTACYQTCGKPIKPLTLTVSALKSLRLSLTL